MCPVSSLLVMSASQERSSGAPMLTPTGAGLCWAAVGAISVDFQRMTTGVIGPRRRMRHGSAYGKQPLVQGLACHSFDQVQLLSQTTRRQIVVRTRRYPLVCPVRDPGGARRRC